MARVLSLAAIAVGAAGLALWSASARAEVDESTGLEEADMRDIPPLQAGDDGDETLTTDLVDTMSQASPDELLSAFLVMIRSCEHAQADVASDLDYVTFYGGSRFTNLADHPVLTGEKRGVPLDNLGSQYVGKVSTAAGAYQINVPTWRDVRSQGAWGGYLGDFSEASQDEAARRLLQRCGALPYVLSGDIERAIARASGVWASLPGSAAKQRGRTLDFALSKFNEALA
jgi:muramidase (phage lysozyme)